MKTPPSGSRRPAGKGPAGSGARKPSESSLAQVTKGREVEFWGIGLVSLGLLLILSMWAYMERMRSRP
ncbi:MAG: hypothetical protein RLZZ93_1482, partial [Actinomycetota bacterium]